jgi:virulence-associated protein VagC
MAITKETQIEKIEVVGEYKAVQIATDTIIKEDNVEISRSRHRHVIHPGTLDASDNLVATDISSEDAEVQAVANAVWTDAVKTTWKNKLIADKLL